MNVKYSASNAGNRNRKEKLMNVDTNKLVNLLLDQFWHKQCEILPDYKPPHAHCDAKPTVQIKFQGTSYPLFLRYSRGPKQGYFWDIYGDDMHSIEVAILALSRAPVPSSIVQLT